MIKAVINKQEYSADISPDGGSVHIYNVISKDNGAYLGTFLLDNDDNIIEHFPMENVYIPIGKIVRE